MSGQDLDLLMALYQPLRESEANLIAYAVNKALVGKKGGKRGR